MLTAPRIRRLVMGKTTLTSAGVTAYLDESEVELRIHEDNGAFKAIPRPEHMATWRKLVALPCDETNISSEKIVLSATDLFAAEIELRKLLSSNERVTISNSTLFRYTKDRMRFTLHTDQKQPARLEITSAPERMNSGNPTAGAYLIALKSSLMCRSAEMLSNGIEVYLAPKYCSDKNRLTTYQNLVDLY